MFNFEKYLKDIDVMPFALVNGEIKRCHGTMCNVCDFCDTEMDCEVLRKEWLLEHTEYEYKYYVTCMTDGTIEGVYVDTEKPLNSMDSLEGLKDKLKDFTGFENVCILNWRELEA